MSRVTPFPPKWPVGFYLYGGNRLSRGKSPSWVERLLETGVNIESETTLDSTLEPAEEDEDIRDQVRERVDEEQSRDEDADIKVQPAVEEGDIQVPESSGDIQQETAGVEPPVTNGRYNLRPRTGFPLWLVDQPD